MANIKAYIREVFKEEPTVAVLVAMAESGLSMQQSKHFYTAKNVPKGFKVGDQEQSFCIFQIHEPVHKDTIKRLGLEDYRTNVESCVKIAYEVYKQRGNFTAWSVYTNGSYKLAMR